jgi:DNA-binding MarR family transcriptional regulator
MSKQAMNQLLLSLEGSGYVLRTAIKGNARGRVVRFTKRGRDAYAMISDILRDIEREWIAELGPRPFAELKTLLTRVWQSPLAW